MIAWWLKLDWVERFIVAAIGALIVSVTLATITADGPTDADRLLCITAGGVPIMDEHRTRMVNCAMPLRSR